MAWGIPPNAEPKEKVKADLLDLLKGMNATCAIDIEQYDVIAHAALSALDSMYSIGYTKGFHDGSRFGKEQTGKIPTKICTECHGGGFSKTGSGYDAICDKCGGNGEIPL